MSIKSSMMFAAMLGMVAANGLMDFGGSSPYMGLDGLPSSPHDKRELSPKQQKRRQKSKMARASRKRNRKR